VDGGNRLAENLRTNKSLTWLNVNSCGINGEAWRLCLKYNTTLTRLDAFEGNDTNFISGGFIDNMVKVRQTTQSVKLKSNQISQSSQTSLRFGF